MDEVARWAASGAMALTGDADGPPLAPVTSAASRMDELLAPFGLDARVLSERAALLGLERSGSTSAGGATRLLEAADGWFVLALPRPEDRDLVPALLGIAPDGVDWPAVQAAVRERPVAGLVAGAELLGLAAGAVGEGGAAVTVRGAPRPGAQPSDRWRVIDLSALWAGPLCTHLLTRAGADVVKAESVGRPDGARAGNRAFFELLDAGKEGASFDHTTADGRRALADLVDSADVVVTSSRRRAIEQLGLDPDAFLAGGDDRIWVAITGHGWGSDRIGFGDDAAAAAGLVAWGDDGRPRFAGDAIADPLSGATAAAEVVRRRALGGRWFVDVPLVGAAAAVVTAPPALARAADALPGDGWSIDGVRVEDPAPRVGW
ncbi:MAG: CoA transferase [Actinobacteria bacterium]|nr:CoA transferase [Actinomycetota bacterium]